MSSLRSICVIDDDMIYQFAVKLNLKQHKLAEEVITFDNGEMAKNYFEENCADEEKLPDVILLDINMPIMDGMECARRVRALPDPEKARTPMVAITGNAKNYSTEDFKEAGFNDILIKPLNFDALVALVKSLTE